MCFTPRVLESLVTRNTAATLPIVPVDDKALSTWRRPQSRAVKAWVAASPFEPQGNRVLVVPGGEGPATALLGRTEESLWTWAAAAQRLPPGRYRIEDDLGPDAATAAATGWALEKSKKRKWLHLDVFAWTDHAKPGRPIGGEATGMRALWQLLKGRYAPESESTGA